MRKIKVIDERGRVHHISSAALTGGGRGHHVHIHVHVHGLEAAVSSGGVGHGYSAGYAGYAGYGGYAGYAGYGETKKRPAKKAGKSKKRAAKKHAAKKRR